MKTELILKTANTVSLDQVLSNSVVLSWNSLGLGSAISAVNIEYHVDPEGAVDSLKLWACSGQYSSLICEYSPHVGWSDGPRFTNGFHSRQLGRLLQSILLNGPLFAHGRRPNTNGTIEIGPPTVEQTTDATMQLHEAFDGLQ